MSILKLSVSFFLGLGSLIGFASAPGSVLKARKQEHIFIRIDYEGDSPSHGPNVFSLKAVKFKQGLKESLLPYHLPNSNYRINVTLATGKILIATGLKWCESRPRLIPEPGKPPVCVTFATWVATVKTTESIKSIALVRGAEQLWFQNTEQSDLPIEASEKGCPSPFQIKHSVPHA